MRLATESIRLVSGMAAFCTARSRVQTPPEAPHCKCGAHAFTIYRSCMKTPAFDPHNTAADLTRTLEILKEDPNLSEQNKKTILRFYEACGAEGLKPIHLLRLLQLLRLTGGSLKKSFDKGTRSDVQKYLRSGERRVGKEGI